MTALQIKSVREALGLGQVEFSQLFGIHPITVSKWENGHALPTPYQQALLAQFGASAGNKKVQDELKNVLVAAGVVCALALLLSTLGKK